MSTKNLLLFVVFIWATPALSTETEGKNLSDRLAGLEETIANAELATAECQMWTGWHFPGSLYHYIDLAKEYSAAGKKMRSTRKFYQSLQSLLSVVTECIEGTEGYFCGNQNDVWVNPTPSVPECAIEVFKDLKSVLETELAAF